MVLECSVEACQRTACIVEMGVGIIQRAAVMGAQDKETHYLRVILFEHIANREEVAQGLGHLFVINADKAVVHPVIHILAVMRMPVHSPFGLGDLVLVVRELQILAATMNIKVLARECRCPWPSTRYASPDDQRPRVSPI